VVLRDQKAFPISHHSKLHWSEGVVASKHEILTDASVRPQCLTAWRQTSIRKQSHSRLTHQLLNSNTFMTEHNIPKLSALVSVASNTVLTGHSIKIKFESRDMIVVHIDDKGIQF
jgi:hypothetical protein